MFEMPSVFVPLTPAGSRRRLIPIYAQPCSGHVAIGNSIEETFDILQGSDLSMVRGTGSFDLFSVYSDSSLRSAVITTTRPNPTTAKISFLAPDSEKKDSLIEKYSISFKGNEGLNIITIFGGSTIMTTDKQYTHRLYELDANSCKMGIAEKEFNTTLEGSVRNYCPFAVPLSSRVHLANVNSRNSLAVIDFRDTAATGASAWIVSEGIDFRSGVKAASRLFLQGHGEESCLACVDCGSIRSTSMSLASNRRNSRNQYFREAIFAFSDVNPTVGFNDHCSTRLFDVRRERLAAEIDTSRFTSIQPLFVDGMPQLVGIQRISARMGLIL